MRKNKISITILIILVLSILSLVIYIFMTKNYIPKVKYTIELSNITKKEYNSIIDNNKPKLQNLKKIYIKIEISNSKNCKKREIIIPDLNVIDNYDTVRSYKSGDSTINNLHNDENAESTKYIIFNSTDLSLDDIKDIYSDEYIDVNIITKDNKMVTSKYNIGKLLKD